MQEDPACLYAWCDEYTLICTLRGCLLAQMAFAHCVQRQNASNESEESFVESSTGDSAVTEQHQSGNSSSLLHLVIEILQVLEVIRSLASRHGMQPSCERRVEHVVLLLSQVHSRPNAWDIRGRA
jgi:hypothetical protein